MDPYEDPSGGVIGPFGFVDVLFFVLQCLLPFVLLLAVSLLGWGLLLFRRFVIQVQRIADGLERQRGDAEPGDGPTNGQAPE